MRQRRAERCIARAEEALAEGREDQAIEALDEARRLAPADTPDLETLRARVTSHDALREFGSEVEVPLPASRPRRHVGGLAAAALLILALGAGTTWFVQSRESGPDQVASAPAQSARSEPPAAPARIDVPAPAVPAAALPAKPVPQAQETVPPVSTPPPEVQRAVREDAPVRTALAPPPAIGTAGAADLPLSASARPEVPVEAPPPPVVAPPSLPATPLENVAAGTPVTSPSAPRPVPPPPTPSRPEPPPERAAEPAARPAAEAPAKPAAEPRIRAVLSSYEAAFRSLDASAVQRIWPGVDERALARAFEGLSSQSVSLGNCAFAITGTSATAQCTGSATWTPKVGSGSRTVARRWQFALQNAGDDWQIVRADVR